jgi:hypothetical protein
MTGIFTTKGTLSLISTQIPTEIKTLLWKFYVTIILYDKRLR